MDSVLVQGKVGQTTATDGSEENLRLGNTCEVAVMQSHGDYYDAVKRGFVFGASMQAAAALGTGLTATGVTFTLYNASTTKNLVILETHLAVVVGTTAGFVVYAINDTVGQAAPATVTAISSGIHNLLLGSTNGSVAAVYTVATLPAAPKAIRTLAGIISTTPGGVHSIVDKVNGGIIVSPNMSVTIQGVTTNATGVIGMTWEEVPI
jgi:hypothetical protein